AGFASLADGRTSGYGAPGLRAIISNPIPSSAPAFGARNSLEATIPNAPAINDAACHATAPRKWTSRHLMGEQRSIQWISEGPSPHGTFSMLSTSASALLASWE